MQELSVQYYTIKTLQVGTYRQHVSHRSVCMVCIYSCLSVAAKLLIHFRIEHSTVRSMGKGRDSRSARSLYSPSACRTPSWCQHSFALLSAVMSRNTGQRHQHRAVVDCVFSGERWYPDCLVLPLYSATDGDDSADPAGLGLMDES